MRQQLLEVNKFPADMYTADEAWEVFLTTWGYKHYMKENPNTVFVVNTEEDWQYVYKVGIY